MTGDEPRHADGCPRRFSRRVRRYETIERCCCGLVKVTRTGPAGQDDIPPFPPAGFPLPPWARER